LALSDLTQPALARLRGAADTVTDWMTPTVRLGVTGLARSGKTVFITALVRNLVEGGRLPFFGAMAEGRILRAYLTPQPDDDVPRFPYEEHLAVLAREPPDWPESTRRVSQLRVTVEYLSRSMLKRGFGIDRLHIDIVDYPGEWLLDLGLIDLDFRAWANATVALAQDARHRAIAAPWLSHVASLEAEGPADEQAVLHGSRLFAAYLRAARGAGLGGVGPGRFLMPGDLDGSPLLTFLPVPVPEGASIHRGSLPAMLERRYEAYKAHVVMPFFLDYFSRIDRQIVLVDALSALNGGEDALADVRRTLGAVLAPFKVGSGNWFMALVTRRIDRILFAAAKSDHVHHTSHARLEALLADIAHEAADRATMAGAEIKLMALSALRATREAEVARSNEPLPCVVGTPLPGEQVAGRTFNGRETAAIFTGDLPAERSVRGEATAIAAAQDVKVIRFRPPRIAPAQGSGAPSPWPHIRLDRALDFLVGDRLA
jgi:predicted YcjX-like family ATPase